MHKIRLLLSPAVLAIFSGVSPASPILPAASAFLQVNGTNAPPPSTSIPGAVSFSSVSGSGACTNLMNCSFSISAADTVGPSVAVMASSTNTFFDGNALATMSYSYEIVGAASEEVPIMLTYILSGTGNALQGTTPGWQVGAEIVASNNGPELLDNWVASTDGECSHLIDDVPVAATCPSSTFQEVGHAALSVDSNTVYTIELNANLSSQINSSASAFADPFIQIDPAFADASQFSVIVSPGIDNVALSTPEPGGAGMLALGLAGLAVLARRKSLS
jgi:hypothetical protein